jgi:hypothetical protein
VQDFDERSTKMIKKLTMLFVAAFAAMGACAAIETKYLGAPHCRVEYYDDYWGDCTNIGLFFYCKMVRKIIDIPCAYEIFVTKKS